MQIISLICIGIVVLATFYIMAFNIFKLMMPAFKKFMRRAGRFIGAVAPGIEAKAVFNSFEELIESVGFAYDNERDYFFSSLYPWQRRYGYTRLYDVVAPPLSMIIDSEPIRFEYNGYKWMVELWKGQYGMTTGCEVGVYVTKKPEIFLSKISDDKKEQDPELDDEGRWDRLIELATPFLKNKEDKNYINYDEMLGFNTTFYHSADDDELLYMSFVARKNNKIILANRGNHWWLTGFKLGEFSEPSEIKMSISITFKDRDMRDAFLTAMFKMGYKQKDVYIRNNTVQFMFDKPYSKQPYTRTEITDKISQNRNKSFCEMYNEITAGAAETPDKLKLLYEKNPVLFHKAFLLGKPRQLFTGLTE